MKRLTRVLALAGVFAAGVGVMVVWKVWDRDDELHLAERTDGGDWSAGDLTRRASLW